MILENIRRLCKERQTNISALEHDLGFGKSTIAKWDTASPRIDSVQKVAEFFGVTVDELLTARKEVG